MTIVVLIMTAARQQIRAPDIVLIEAREIPLRSGIIHWRGHAADGRRDVVKRSAKANAGAEQQQDDNITFRAEIERARDIPIGH